MTTISRLGFLRISGALLLLAAAFTGAAQAQEFCNSGSNGGSRAEYPYLLNNNTFGWGQDTGGWECITPQYNSYYKPNNTYYNGWQPVWNWPTNNNPYSVKAYPSLVYGWQYGYTYGGLGLPSQIWVGKNVPTYQAFNFWGSQNEDVLIDNWILNSANASSQADEVEIFVSNNIGACCGGNNLGNQTVDGIYYYLSSRAPYANGGGNSWWVYNFIPNQGSTNMSQSVNVKDYVNVLAYDYGALNSNQYLAGVQLGVEVYHGSGGVTFSSSSVSTY